MSVQFPYYPIGDVSYSYSGWTCNQCGSWVPNGCTHSCPTAVRWINPPPPPVPDVYERIAAALERIATQLEGAD